MKKLEKYRLPLGDYHRLKKILQREPIDLELALASALWNEHCSYRSSQKYLRSFAFPTSKKVSAQGEQAGVVDLGQGERVAFKMESHNHPSFITPYHGAATGVGGILRDIFAMNARPILVADYLCFGSSSSDGGKGRVNGVIRGIGGYGNCIGIPTLTGHTEFASCYDKNILVNAMALGFLNSKDLVMSSVAKDVGYLVVYAGAKTGRDGVLGASMASESFEGNEEQLTSTVQIGDPFYGKQLMEATLLAMKKGLISSCQDMGAAGLTCSSFEMVEKGGLGLKLYLDKVPLRDATMSPEEILLSESQERMLFICKPSCLKDLKQIFETRNLDLVVVGETIKKKIVDLYWQEKSILEVEFEKWTAPLDEHPYNLPEPAPRVSFQPEKYDLKQTLLKFLKHPQGRSRDFIYHQYDQRVGTKTRKESSFPIAVIRLPETQRDLAVAMGCRNHIMKADVREGAKDSIYYPALQLSLRGFTPWAVTDCLNFGNPTNPKVMGEFILSVQSIAEACKALDTPVISGNVSFYNESQNQNIVPTPAIAMVGLKEKEGEIPPSGFSNEGECVYLLHDHQLCFSGLVSEILNEKQKVYGSLQDEWSQLFVFRILKLVQKFSLTSARVVGKGGVLYTLARMILEKGQGLIAKNKDHCHFQERLYEVIVGVKEKDKDNFEKEVQKSGLSLSFLGETGGTCLKIGSLSVTLDEMKECYQTPWEDLSL